MKTRLTTTLAGVALLGLLPNLTFANPIDFSPEDTHENNNCGPLCGYMTFYGLPWFDGASAPITRWYSGLPHYQEAGKMKVTSTTPPTSVPEPGTTTLVAAGLLLLGFAAWRKRPVSIRKN
jgi:hypothetical protein